MDLLFLPWLPPELAQASRQRRLRSAIETELWLSLRALRILSCSQNSPREPLHRFVFAPEAVSPQTTTLMLETGEKLSFWNSLDVTNKPPVTLQFYISIKAEKEAPVEVVCNALSPTLTFMSSTIEKENHVAESWKLARMTCEFGPIEKKKAVTITATPKAEGIGTIRVDRLVLELKN